MREELIKLLRDKGYDAVEENSIVMILADKETFFEEYQKLYDLVYGEFGYTGSFGMRVAVRSGSGDG